jgi:hypothetical protein
VLPDSSDVWIEYEVSYPSGSGLTSLVKEGAANFDVLVHNPSSFNALFAATFTDDQAGRDAIRPFLTTEYEDGPHREILLKYRPDTTRVLSTVSTGVDTLLLPETAYVADPLNPAADFTVTVNGGGKTITAISEDRKTFDVRSSRSKRRSRGQCRVHPEPSHPSERSRDDLVLPRTRDSSGSVRASGQPG